MQNIDANLKTIFQSDLQPSKTLILTFAEDALNVSNNRIVSEDFSLQEVLSTDHDLKFGSCNASVVKVTVSELVDDLTGREFSITQNTDSYSMDLGYYTIESAKKQEKTLNRDIVAFDRMKKLEINVASWYNALTFPMTKKAFRQSLLSYVGLQEVDRDLPNDTMTVLKTISTSEINGIEVLQHILELDGAFGHIGRDGKVHYIILDTTSVETIGSARVVEDYVEEYTVKAIDKIQLKSDKDDVGSVYGTGTNAYIIQGNFLVYGKTAAELLTIATNASVNIFGRSYIPFTATTRFTHYLDLGDKITLPGVSSYIMNRHIVGVQSINDYLEATGNELRPQFSYTNAKIEQLLNRTNSFIQTIDMMESVIKVTGTIVSDTLVVGDQTIVYPSVLQETMSSLKQTADAFEFLVSQEKIRAQNSESSLSTRITATAEGLSLKISREEAEEIASNTFSATASGWKATITQEVTNAMTPQIQTISQSTFEQSATQIQSTVTQNVRSEISGDLSTLQSQITQNANNINLKVSSSEVQNMINVSVSGIKLTANQIDLLGYITSNGALSISDNGLLKTDTIVVQTIESRTTNPVFIPYLNTGALTINGVGVARMTDLNGYSVQGHGHSTGNTVGASFSSSSIGSSDLITFSNTSGSQNAATATYVNAKVASASDRRLKQNILEMSDITEKYMLLKPVEFEFKEYVGNQYKHCGFIAQDVSDIFPEDVYDLVGVNNSEITIFQRAYCPTGIYEINYNNMHALHTRMIQKHETEIAELKEMILNGK